MSKPVFVSYSTDDTATAEAIRDGLEVAGIPCWMAPRDIAPGLDYGGQIIDAIENCRVFLLVLSESANRSRFVLNEVERAVSKDKVVIPVRIHDVQPSRSLEFFISNAQWLDAIDDINAALDRLKATMARHVPASPATGEPDAENPISDDFWSILAQRHHNLPEQSTPFVGREQELMALDDLLIDSDVRLVTIVGPGGMGKTRLSLAWATRQLETRRYANGIFFVALAPLNSPEQILPAIADGLGFQQDGLRTLRQQVFDYLSSKQMLLVMDNFEHLLDGAELVDQILRAAPGVKILASSRERLHIVQEQVYPIQGLEFPQWETPEDAAEYTAVRLFMQSARRVVPQFELMADDLTYLSRLCRLVDGMPLAIELAASWVDTLSLADIAGEIQQNLDFLETDMRNVPARHRSIRAIFDYSWRQMSSPEQEVFAQLSIFRGGFTRRAAQQIADATIRQLAALTGKSLLQFNKRQDRYQVHELLRQYGAQELGREDQAEANVRERHSAYYLAWLGGIEPDLDSDRQMETLTEIECEIDNIRLAWNWSVEHQAAARIDSALESLAQFWEWSGRFHEGEEACRTALARFTAESALSTHIRLLTWQATFHAWLGHKEESNRLLDQGLSLVAGADESVDDFRAERAAILFQQARWLLESIDPEALKGAREKLEESFSLYEALAARRHMAEVLIFLSRTIFRAPDGDRQEHLEARERLIQRSIHICRQSGNQAILAKALIQLAMVQFFRQVLMIQTDREHFRTIEEAIAVSRRVGLKSSLVHAANAKANWLLNEGNYGQALELIQPIVKLARELGYSHELAGAIRAVGFVALNQGRYQEAKDRFEESLTLYRSIDTRLQECWTLPGLAVAEWYLGNWQVAQSYLVKVIHFVQTNRHIIPAGNVLGLSGLVLVRREKPELALTCLGLLQCNAHLLSDGAAKKLSEQIVSAAVATLSEEEIASIMAQSRDLDPWTTLAVVLDEIVTHDQDD